jgi:SAM-dependent methyltransferase
VDYDAELRLHNDALRRASEIGPRDRVLDIGCGTGTTTRDAARLAADGWALGVDISKESIERARLLAEAEALRNVTFEHADAQDHAFPSERFDVAISRFGTMFFQDPVAAFTNIGHGIRPTGRLVMMVWQRHERNEWSVEIEKALTGAEGSPSSAPAGLDPFSLADQSTVRGILDAAGFVNVTFTEVHEPVFYGRSVADALTWVRGFACTHAVLDALDHDAAERAIGRVRESFARHARDDGIWFDSNVWIVEARRRSGGRPSGRQDVEEDRLGFG